MLPNEIPRRIVDKKRTHFYEHYKFNERRGEAQRNKNNSGKIITTLPKKWIRDHKQ
jgi:hypothetical protein